MRAEMTAAGTDLAVGDPSDVLAGFFRVFPDLLCVIDANGVLVRVNDAAERITGYQPAELAGQSVLRFLHPDDAQQTAAAWNMSVPVSQPGEVVTRVRCKDGSWRWLEWSAFYSDGLGYAVARDVTARKRTEERLRGSERLLQTVIDGITDPIFAKNRQGRYVLLNQAAARALGKPATEVIGKGDHDVFPSEDASGIIDRDASVMKGAQTVSYEESVTIANGQRVTFLATKGPVFDERGQVVGLFGISRDITDQLRAEQALRASEQRFQELLDRMPAACSVKDARFKLVYVNRAFIREFGTRDWLGKSASEVFPPEQAEAFERTDRLVLETGEPLEAEQLVPVDKEMRRFVTHKFRMQGESGPMVGTVSFDITERRREEENRLALERRLAEAHQLESLGVLAGGIAHDFNNLLQTIMGNANLASREAESVANVQVYLDEIELAAQRATELTRQMLAYSGQAQPVVRPLDLNLLISQTGDALTTTLPVAIQVERQVAADLPLVEADAGQIRQVLTSLVMNAAEAIGDGEGTIRISTGTVQTARDRLPDSYVVSDGFGGPTFALLEVADTGCGMDDETRTRVFEPFFTTKLAGRGLGMAGVLGIVQRHQGAISVESEPGTGTSVRVLLPALDEE
jgi:two-component system, cell cycle sensor histidine kinase and response regulator CckA